MWSITNKRVTKKTSARQHNKGITVKEEPYDPEYDTALSNPAEESSTSSTGSNSDESLGLPTVKTEPLDPPYQDEGHDDASDLEETDPIRMWTVSSSNLVPFDKDEIRPVQASSAYEHISNVAGVRKRGHDGLDSQTQKRMKQEYEDTSDDETQNKKEEVNLTCKYCSVTLPSKLLLESHVCKDAIYYCKICYMESTRTRQYALMPYSVAEDHFYVHFHQGYFKNKDSKRTDKMSFKFQVPEELRGKITNSEEDLALLKDLYIGLFEQSEKPFSCGLCGSNFTLTGPRAWHVTKAHMEHKHRRCGGADCARLSFPTKDKLLRHMFEAHCDLDVKERVWKCKLCTMQFDDRTDQEWHFYWHMKPAVKIGAASTKYSQGRPAIAQLGGAGRTQFRCTICSYETVESEKVPLYTSSEAHDHLAWHWSSQPPPEIQKNPILNFDKDSGTIHDLYMMPFGSHLSVACKFCGMNITVEATYKHLESYHKDLIRDPHCCMRPECRHIQYTKKEDFFDHMFSQHITVVRKKKCKFLCQICYKTLDNRCVAEWHCFFHKIRGDK